MRPPFQIANPGETTSDSFYFAGDQLMMHNKATYTYIVEDRAQAKRSYDHLNPDKVSKVKRNTTKSPTKGSKLVKVGHSFFRPSRALK